jgi:hypothetical protein
MRLTKQEILDETVEYYRTHPRGLNTDGECVYCAGSGADPEAPRCAVGRCMKPEALDIWGGWKGNASSLDEKLWLAGGGTLDNILLPQHRGHRNTFWCDLQILHDSGAMILHDSGASDYWESNDTGGVDLTDVGQEAYEQFVLNIKEGRYDDPR